MAFVRQSSVKAVINITTILKKKRITVQNIEYSVIAFQLRVSKVVVDH